MNSSQDILSRIRGIENPGRRAIVLALIVAMTAFAAVAVTPVHAQNISVDLKEALEYQHQGRYKDAVEIYTEVLEKNPSVVEALDWRAMAYIDLNRLDKALADLDRAIKLSPKYADAYNNRGEVYRKKKMYRKAMADYRRAAQLNKKFAEPHYNMALILENDKNYRGAIGEYRKYLQLQPKAEDRQEIEAKIASLDKEAQAAKRAPRRPAHAPAVRHAPPAQGKPHARVAPHAAPHHPKPFSMPKQQEIPGVGGISVPPGVMPIIQMLGAVAMVLPLAFYIFFAVMLFLIARKTGTGLAWLAFIPIANIYLMIRIAGKPVWWLAILIVLSVLPAVLAPLAMMDPTGGYIVTAVSILCVLAVAITWLLICLGISNARGKSVVWGVLLFIPCVSLIALGYLGLSR